MARPRSLPCLSLHLYRIEEKRHLYRPERVRLTSPDGTDGGAIVCRHPPIYIGAQYAILAWGRDADEEHTLLGEVLAVVADTPHLVAGEGEQISLRLTDSVGLSDQKAILDSLGIPLRPLISCSATARLDSIRTTAHPAVQARSVRISESPGARRV
jgi:hypothetical protein